MKIFNCLKNIFRQSKENSNDFHPDADNNIPREISDTENIARFIFSPINVNPKNDNLKPNCFKPPAGNDEVSVNRYDFTNENFLKKFEEVELHFEGYFTKVEFEIVEKISKISRIEDIIKK